MKRYVKQTTNSIHYIADIRNEYPNMSIPDDADCTGLGYVFLVETQAPVQQWFYTREITPILNVQQWELVPMNTDEIKSIFTSAIQNHMDVKAQEKNYDNIVSACSYAGYDNPFRAESEAYGVWRANCWQVGYQILAEVEAGTIPMPTIEEVLAEMPELVLS